MDILSLESALKAEEKINNLNKEEFQLEKTLLLFPNKFLNLRLPSKIKGRKLKSYHNNNSIWLANKSRFDYTKETIPVTININNKFFKKEIDIYNNLSRSGVIIDIIGLLYNELDQLGVKLPLETKNKIDQIKITVDDYNNNLKTVIDFEYSEGLELSTGIDNYQIRISNPIKAVYGNIKEFLLDLNTDELKRLKRQIRIYNDSINDSEIINNLNNNDDIKNTESKLLENQSIYELVAKSIYNYNEEEDYNNVNITTDKNTPIEEIMNELNIKKELLKKSIII